MASNQNDPARAGNELFVRNEYEQALEAYSTAIEKYPDTAELYWNRALTYLKLDRPFNALNDIDTGLKSKPDNDKLIYRKCTTLLNLRRFSEAGQFLDESIGRLEQLTNKKNYKALINDMDRLKKEYEYGQYDLPAMVEESKKSKYLDNHADYFAWNKFEIRDVAGKGRGLVAKEKIEAGELLIACKPFVFDEVGYTDDDDLSMDLTASGIPGIPHGTERLCLVAMVEKASEKLKYRPDVAEEFYRLYAGPNLRHLEKWTEGESNLIDKDRIESIVRSIRMSTGGSSNSRPPTFDVGVWFVASYINHSCVDTNCHRYFVGDYIFVRATKAIDTGSEILFYYCPPMESFENRQRICRDMFGFDCQCRLCVMDRRDPIEIKERMGEIRKFVTDWGWARAGRNEHPFSVRSSDIEKSFRESLQIRPQRDLNYLALQIQHNLAIVTRPIDNAKSVRMLTECFELHKSNGCVNEALTTCKILHSASEFMGGDEQGKWKMEARRITKLFYGDERVANSMAWMR